MMLCHPPRVEGFNSSAFVLNDPYPIEAVIGDFLTERSFLSQQSPYQSYHLKIVDIFC